ncbi:MAG: type II secretion system protein GspJ [SAR92 clade bacterium]|uniref:Type II secretion system protein J n=1 Tax=SAR92 clade bacterium TaxID=2315479 RepID=A0A520LNT0_9GAMM|nr:MAG: type II secretion system protein GspJ [SAR92 clade bacterium]
MYSCCLFNKEQLILKKQLGFTLIEVIVSLFLLSILSIMSYQAVEVMTQMNKRSQESFQDESQLAQALQIIGRDFLHIKPRRFYDGLSEMEDAYFTDPSDFGIRFTRGGGPSIKSNPSGLRRIDYRLNVDDQLIRTSWGATESPRQSDGVKLRLLDNVSEIKINHLDANGNYHPDWPPPNAPARSGKLLPRMIEIKITFKNEAEITRLYPGVISN